jgi:calpain-7
MADELSSPSSRDTENETFLTLHVHRGGKRLYAPAPPFIKGIYSSDPHILTRIDISAEDTRGANEVSLEHPQGKPIEFTLVLSQNDKRRDVSYTLSVYSTSLPFVCRLLPPLPLNQVARLSSISVSFNRPPSSPPYPPRLT